MARVKLPVDATIASVQGTLKKPEAYICGVLTKLHAGQRVHASAAVRIGVTGRGISPYYRIVHGAQHGTPDDNSQIFGAFYDNHEPLEVATSSEMNGHWSTEFMTIEEVGQLRAQLPSKHGRRA
ncbi:hypothetical protein [Methylobacterium cerastii]|uniref:hypothetical protein n=1 Tax=Methylobacterium cerastii TaxID=932741 RepID=UPI001EE1A0CC|nr:hypothetical protein [Methylobacterium cerastii]